MRWADHILALDDERLRLLWRDPKPSRVVLGLGFDPRASAGLEAYLALSPKPPESVLAVVFSVDEEAEPTTSLAAHNAARLSDLCDAAGVRLETCSRPIGSDSRARGLRLARDITEEQVLGGVERVVIDISGLPTSVYFPLIGSVLARLDADGRAAAVDLQIIVAEDPDLDARIRAEGTITPGSVGGFNNGLDLDAAPPGPRVWAPVLGEGSGAQLELLRQRLTPDEVCPALPFPAKNPRRADQLVLEHRELLFDRLEAEAGNFIYADERNPFDLYRALSRLDERYRRALAPLGESQLVLSTHSSKTLSLGVLLAAYERGLPVVSAGPQRHAFDPESRDQSYDAPQVAGLWITGEPYA